MTTRQVALEKLGVLRRKRSSTATATDPEQLRIYYDRQVSKNRDGRLSQRRIDAFIGFCSSCSPKTSGDCLKVIVDGLRSIILRWHITSTQGLYEDNDNGQLRHLSVIAFQAAIRVNSIELGLVDHVYQDVMHYIEAIGSSHKRITPEIMALTGFLEAAARQPEVVSYGQFVTLVQALSNLLETIDKSTPALKDCSFEDLQQILDATQSPMLQLQESCAKFVLSWSEQTMASLYVSTRLDLWKTLRTPEKLESESVVVDQIVWTVVAEHVQLQYKLVAKLELSSNSGTVLGYVIRAYSISLIATHESTDNLSSWITNVLLDLFDTEESKLGFFLIDVISALAVRIPTHLPDTIAMLNRIVQYAPRPEQPMSLSLASFAATQLLYLLERASQDSLIGTISNLANLLNGPIEVESKIAGASGNDASVDGASILSQVDLGERMSVNVVEAVGVFGSLCTDMKVSVFALNVLLQKTEKVSGPSRNQIMEELARISVRCSEKDILRIATFYDKVEETSSDKLTLDCIRSARCAIASVLAATESKAFEMFLESLLRTGIQRARTIRKHYNMESVLLPLSELLKAEHFQSLKLDFDLTQLFHNFWFNLVLAGYLVRSTKVDQEIVVLKIIARYSPSLALETLTDSFEADLESYPLLKQAHEHEETKYLQTALDNFVSGGPSRVHNFAEAVYMNALALLENLKSQSGIACGSLSYYRQSTMVQSEVRGVLAAISLQNTKHFLRSIQSSEGSVHLDSQLHKLLIGCCDQIQAVRAQSARIIDQIVTDIPTAFCSSFAMTTLLECVTLLGWACYEEYSDKYSPTYSFRSARLDLTIIVSDSFKDRQENLATFRKLAKNWLSQAMLESVSDVRTLLTSYITLAEDHASAPASDMGKLLAIDMATHASSLDQPTDHSNIRDCSAAFLGELTLRHIQLASNLHSFQESSPSSPTAVSLSRPDSLYIRSQTQKYIPFSELREKLCSYVVRILASRQESARLICHLVEIPFNIFSTAAFRLATSLWARLIHEKPTLQADLFAEISKCWNKTARDRRGMFSPSVNADHPFSRVMEYAPTNKDAIAKEGKFARALIEPHLIVLRFLSGHLAASQNLDHEAQKILLRMLCYTMKAMVQGRVSNHVFAQELRLRVLLMGIRMKMLLPMLGLEVVRDQLSVLLYDAGLSLFASSPRWAFGSDVGQMKVDRQLIAQFLSAMRTDLVPKQSSLSEKTRLLTILLETEISRIYLWLNPVSQNRTTSFDVSQVQRYLAAAWRSSPSVAVSLAQRFPSVVLQNTIKQMVLRRPWQCLGNAEAAELVIGSELSTDTHHVLKYLLYWTPVVPISAIVYFLPSFQSHPFLLQYAMRSLESHPVEVTFFYVPQIVQVLRHDVLGYVRRFIIETAKLSQLFAHQIIWNFDANAYKDEEATMPDNIKPTLDSIKSEMLKNLSGTDKDFYETEFRFFGEVTSISGKLKPFIKKSKPEKKAKIDEEMAIIKVEEGVYLPSNPDGVVVGIDRKSGRPLQSHAKAPFMATFVIRKSQQVEAAFEEDLQVEEPRNRKSITQPQGTFEKRQSAIFKVGDDCRQDVLALQLISTFRSIFNSIGLDLYVFPYRVTATAPGCGVIDVLPNSVSRDMLGREAVNGLYDYFLTTFGKPETVAFQTARMNFVKSLAAYSVITYLLQFKDRHNGNIMYDAQGHVLHIDFGFCFDIAPGGITFESAPFKLTTEMVAVMGGSTDTQSYKLFQELCVKAFLVARQYSDKIIHLVTLMLESGLPCFKGQTTITNLRNRFHMEATEQQASSIMIHLISQAHLNQRTVAYDLFQKLTNGIPY